MNSRPTSPERLTPREWEVLALVREGLTNEEIGERLGISRDGVKYHVSEVLGKLGVEDRIAAARWYDRKTRSRAGLAAFFGGLFGGREVDSKWRGLAAGAIAVVVVGFLALAIGLIVMESRGDSADEPRAEGTPDDQQDESVDPLPNDRLTGDPALDELFATLVNGDVGQIAVIAGGVWAREFESSTGVETRLPPADWADALTSARLRELYAVLEGDPQAGPSRDFDAYLAVVAVSGIVQGWQIAIDAGEIVDITIGVSPVWLADNLSFQPERFVVLPPATDQPKQPEVHALSERTGNGAINAVLDAVEAGDAQSLFAFEDVACGPGPAPFCDNQPEGTVVPSLNVRECGGTLQQAW